MSLKRDEKFTARIDKLQEDCDEWRSAARAASSQAKESTEELVKWKEADREIGAYIDSLNDENAELRNQVEALAQEMAEREERIKQLEADALDHRKGHRFHLDLLAMFGLSQDDIYNVLDQMRNGLPMQQAFVRTMGRRIPPAPNGN